MYSCSRYNVFRNIFLITFGFALINYFFIINSKDVTTIKGVHSSSGSNGISKFTPIYNQKSVPISRKYSNNQFIQQRLAQSNQNWIRNNDRIGKSKYQRGIVIWYSFLPSYDCPYTKERIGRPGDGGKWICGMEELEKINDEDGGCLVYSFGVSDDTSFEEEMLQRTNCTVRMFDPTVKAPELVLKQFPIKSTFEAVGLRNSSKPNKIIRSKESNTPLRMSSIQALMTSYSDTFIDVLKVDIEGGEWYAMNQAINGFPPGKLPFGQLVIELHLNRIPEPMYDSMLQWWNEMESAGFRAYESETNYNKGGLEAKEYSFINILNGPFELE